jgi:hypothetical protein
MFAMMTAPDLPPDSAHPSFTRKVASITVIAFVLLCSVLVSTQLNIFSAQESFGSSPVHDGELLKVRMSFSSFLWFLILLLYILKFSTFLI